MPDVGPNYSLPPGYFVQTGDTILPSQHNPVLEDLAAGMNARMLRNGTSPMTGNLQMGSKQITGLAAASQPHHAPRLDQVTPRSAFLLSVSALSLAANEMVYASGANTAAKTPLTAFARTLLDDASAAAARTTLGLGAAATDNIIPVARGGTGSTTASAARNALGLGATATDDIVPISRGGTGSSNVAGALTALGIQPASITPTGGNTVSGGTHTHALSEATVRTLIADGGAGAPGTYAYLGSVAFGIALMPGETYSGANLRYAGAHADTELTNTVISTATPTGTWRVMGGVPAQSGRRSVTLFMRIA